VTPDVFVVHTEPHYPAFPITETNSDGVLRGLRNLFSLWGKNPDNPFEKLIGPGGRVVIKPNWVRDYNPSGHGLDCLITHASLIKHMIDFVAVALHGKGTIVIGDAPLQSCDFQALVDRSRVGEVVCSAQQHYPGVEIVLEDWRLTLADRFNVFGEWDRPVAQSLRENYESLLRKNYQLIDLGTGSFLEDIADYAERFRVTCYKPSLMFAHHRAGKHEYLVTKRIFDADLLINLPKMKTHIKAGLTGALKNLVGINGHKEYLAHHIQGSYFEGGDCYYTSGALRRWHDKLYDRMWEHYMETPAVQRALRLRWLQVLWGLSCLLGGGHIDAGSWSGNETIWRTTLDLNHILHFNPMSPRHILTIVDGVIAGEGNGPLAPTAKATGLLIGGTNPAYVDAVIGKLMGYNISRVPTVYHAIYHRRSQFAGPCLENFLVKRMLRDGKAESLPFSRLPNLQFAMPDYWKRAATGQRMAELEGAGKQ